MNHKHAREPSKPLPPLPPSNFAPLTPEARLHLRNILAQAIADEEIEPAWIDAILVALDEFATAMATGGWLVGIRKLKAQLDKDRETRMRKRMDSLQNSVELPVKDKNGEMPEKSKAVEVSALTVDDASNPGPTTHDDLVGSTSTEESRKQHRTTLVLSQLQKHLLLSPSLVNGADKFHLLLTVSPPPTFYHPHVLTFHIGQTKPTCLFTPGIFSLPYFESDGQKGDGGSVICGVNDWAGQLCLLSECILGLKGSLFLQTQTSSPMRFMLLAVCSP